jgi:hypothetical protein
MKQKLPKPTIRRAMHKNIYTINMKNGMKIM